MSELEDSRCKHGKALSTRYPCPFCEPDRYALTCRHGVLSSGTEKCFLCDNETEEKKTQVRSDIFYIKRELTRICFLLHNAMEGLEELKSDIVKLGGKKNVNT